VKRVNMCENNGITADDDVGTNFTSRIVHLEQFSSDPQHQMAPESKGMTMLVKSGGAGWGSKPLHTQI
jgi:hypothetical protein